MRAKFELIRVPSLGNRLYRLESVDVVCRSLDTKPGEDSTLELLENLGTRSGGNLILEISVIGALLGVLTISLRTSTLMNHTGSNSMMNRLAKGSVLLASVAAASLPRRSRAAPPLIVDKARSIFTPRILMQLPTRREGWEEVLSFRLSHQEVS